MARKSPEKAQRKSRKEASALVNFRAQGQSSSLLCQHTLKTAIGCTGIALHSGARVTMTLLPAPADSGIQFRRTDPKGKDKMIPARWDHVVDTRMCTTLGRDGVTVGTIEHLMAALAGCAIDNAVIELNGPEVPIMDGSAYPFVFLIECAGIAEQDEPRRALRVKKAVTLDEGDRFATLLPGEGFAMSFDIDFASAAISRQSIALAVGEGSFKKEIARARTFGFMHEVEQLRAAGLARGGSLDNAVVVSGDKVLNEGGLRYDDEFVRHKVLDAVGDLYLAGAPIVGRFHGTCSGHATNNRLLHALFADQTAWSLDVCTADDVAAPAAQPAWSEGSFAAVHA